MILFKKEGQHEMGTLNINFFKKSAEFLSATKGNYVSNELGGATAW